MADASRFNKRAESRTEFGAMPYWVPLSPVGFLQASAERVLTGRWWRSGHLRVWRQGAILSGMHCDLMHLLSLDEPKTAGFLAQSCESMQGEFIDIGAHVGTYSVPFAKRGWMVTAVEPSVKTFEILKQNVARNGVGKKVRLLNTAVWSTSGFASMYVSTTQSAQDSLVPRRGSVALVPTITLEDLLGRAGRADLVKMDIEGAELAVLSGTNPQSIRRASKWVIEVNVDTVQPVCHLMSQAGYDFRLIEKLVTTKGVYNAYFWLRQP